MSDAWIVILALTALSIGVRASGPLLMGGRQLSPRVASVVDLLAPALLTALIVVETFDGGERIEVNASLAGVAAAGGVLLYDRDALMRAILAAAAVTAALRALGL